MTTTISAPLVPSSPPVVAVIETDRLTKRYGGARGIDAISLLSSHDLDEVERLCDRVAFIRDGRLVAVEHVADLTRRRYRHATVELARPVDGAELGALPGVSDVEIDGCRARFGFEANALDDVVKALARHAVVDLELAHPSLEEVFMTYYEAAEVPA